ncbi:MAG: metallophosphoesterase family protein [Nanoarchaeota archaeon]
MRLLFCADIHGNEMQYFKIFQYARNYDALILGGDLCVKNLDMRAQRNFLQNYLIPRIKELKEAKPDLKIYIMFGNDDFAGNLDVLNKHNDELYHVIMQRKLPLDENFNIVGYPYIPITPFRIKDWEKWDLGQKDNRQNFELEKDIILEGTQTWNMRYEGRHFSLDDEESIETDLYELLMDEPEKNICIFHSPPFNTDLDITYTKNHVGSLAMRMAIEGLQPFITLHGHIHETVEMSGKYMDRLGDTISAAVGNHNTHMTPYALEIELPSRSIKRIKLE